MISGLMLRVVDEKCELVFGAGPRSQNLCNVSTKSLLWRKVTNQRSNSTIKLDILCQIGCNHRSFLICLRRRGAECTNSLSQLL